MPAPDFTPVGMAEPADAAWRQRLDHIVETMRDMSLHSDPQEMVRSYRARMRSIQPNVEHLVAVSRRGMDAPKYRITRSSMVLGEDVDPWRDPSRLPVLQGGFLGDLLYEGRPRLFADLCVDPSDPAIDHMAGMRSFAAIPNFDQGEALNMAVLMSSRPDAFDPARFPEQVWIGNLFGRATGNMVLRNQVRELYAQIEGELRVVADIQKSLLPSGLPEHAALDMSVRYETSRHAGGDYYDFFRHKDGSLGILIADVAGHGTPAAVLMAVVHALAHLAPRQCDCPGEVLMFLNEHLCAKYTSHSIAFVTAFYGVLDARARTLIYANAGHPAPLRRSARGVDALDASNTSLPLGIFPDAAYAPRTVELDAGDAIAFYTDGVSEAFSPSKELFGVERLTRALAGAPGTNAGDVLNHLSAALDAFAAGTPPADDRTLLVLRTR